MPVKPLVILLARLPRHNLSPVGSTVDTKVIARTAPETQSFALLIRGKIAGQADKDGAWALKRV